MKGIDLSSSVLVDISMTCLSHRHCGTAVVSIWTGKSVFFDWWL